MGLIAVIAVFVLLCDARHWRPGELLTIRENIQIAEAQAWWKGRLDLPERKWDSALVQGKVYSHFPPMFTFLSAALVPFFGGVPHWAVTVLVVLPTLILAYLLFFCRTQRVRWAVLAALALVAGTSALPVIEKALRGANPYNINHTLALAGLLTFLVEYFGRGRIAVMAVGLAVAGWSRQLMIVYLIPFWWSAWHEAPSEPRTRRRILAGASTLAVLAVPLASNTLKFGSPLDCGYMHVYNERPEDNFSRDARAHGLFSAHFVPRNAYYANVGLPDLHRIDVAGDRRFYLHPNSWGTGIWWTTPLLLWLLVDWKRIWGEPRERMLLFGALLANIALLFYHSTGYQQRGFNRYSLDYVPVVLALVAPRCFMGQRRWISLAMIGWSIAYFGYLVRLPHVRVG